MSIEKTIKKHKKKLRYSRITRRVAKGRREISVGYILDFSDDFLLIQETDDFRMLGFIVLPKKQIEEIRYNKNDHFYDKIMEWEKIKEQIIPPRKINLNSWKSIFKSLYKQNVNVVIECENPKIDSFNIGPITKVTKKYVSIRYFNTEGVLDKAPTKIKCKNISKVIFDDRYIDTFSKYLSEQKS